MLSGKSRTVGLKIPCCERSGTRLFLVGKSVTVADFVAAYTLDWANEVDLLGGSPQLRGCMDRMYARPNAPPRIAEALATIRA
jgi:glutathione S-transferase